MQDKIFTGAATGHGWKRKMMDKKEKGQITWQCKNSAFFYNNS